MYGGYGGYGGMYGGMGGMYGAGMPGDPNDPNSLTNSFSQSTQATFQMIESIVGAFGGFAQMLESTYMATHSSFFGMFLSLSFLRICFSDVKLTSSSHGVCCRAVWESAKYSWVRLGDFYNNQMVQDVDCEDYGASPAG